MKRGETHSWQTSIIQLECLKKKTPNIVSSVEKDFWEIQAYLKVARVSALEKSTGYRMIKGY